MEDYDEVVILLRDQQGEKISNVVVGTLFGAVPCNILRGELAIKIPEKPRKDGQPHNYQTVYTDQQATFYDGNENSAVAPLLDKQHLLLAGVKSNDARYQIFVTGQLDWGSNLKIHDPVQVSLRHRHATDTGGTIKSTAVIQYVGPVKGLQGITFGVEIVDRHYFGQGTTDGTFQGQRYFICNDGNGMFVSLDKLSQLPTGVYVPEASPRPHGQQPATQTAEKREERKTRRSKAYRFKVGDRVVAFKKDGTPIRGTVKWVGMYEVMDKKNKPFSLAAVGIETDVKVVGSEMESCLPTKSHLFTAGKKKGSLFIREEEVMLESDFGTDNPQQPPATSDQPPHQPPQSHRRGQDGHHPTPHSQKQPSSQPPQQQQYQEERQHGVQRDPTHHGREREEPLNVDDTRKLAEQMGMGSPTQLMQEQSEVLQKAAKEKKGRELKDIKQALHLDPGESLHVKEQEQLMRQFSEGKRVNEMQRNNGSLSDRRAVEHLYDVIPTTSSHHGDSQSRQSHESNLDYPLAQPNAVYPPQQSHDPNLAHPLAQPNAGYPPQQHQGHFQQQSYPHSHPQQQQQESNSHLQQGYPPYAQQGMHHPQPSHGHHVAYAGRPDAGHSGGPPDPTLSAGLGIGSPVQLVGDHSRTGVIRWTGTLPEIKGYVAGVELDGPMEGCGDGVWKGHRYFTCLPGRGFFCPITSLLPDPRVPQASQVGGASTGNPLQAPEWEDEDQLIYAGQIQKYLGDGRGIQGHQNSCYLDATIFGLFALSDVFDSLFLESSPMSLKGSQLSSAVTHVQSEISHMLWRGIVNPLRKNGAVPYESVMKLRNRLDDLGKMEGVNTAEKDPEEFLNMLFKHTLCVEPFIKIKRPCGTEPEFFVQLFVEFDESLKVPTIQALLEKMFKEQHISFDGVPSKLLVQVPRYGKQFQTYKRIIPGIKLDPSPLIDCPYTCYICQEKAWNICDDCKSEFATHRSSDGRVYFCHDCNDKVHRHKSRTSHNPEKCMKLEEVLELELLSVLCIETSHYVCFTRDSEGRWLFFDSMANRVYDQYNIPRGVDCTDQLNHWVYKGSPERLMATGSRELPELVRRFTQDVYMCVYIQPDYGMYG